MKSAMSGLESSSIDVKLKRLDRVYHLNETVEGTIIINAKNGWSHKGVQLNAEGVVHLSLANRGLGLGTDISSVGKPLQIFSFQQEVAVAGKFADGSTEIPFEFVLDSKDGQALIESYHGVYVSVIYSIQISCDRGMMKKSLYREIEFIVEVPSAKPKDPTPVTFDISPDSLENVSPAILSTIPKFKVSGKIHRSFCTINKPFTGELTIEESAAAIRSLELQLVRVETVITDGNPNREATEIQNIQIGEGNVCRNMIVPMYMIFPRLFSCPTIISSKFKIEFEVNLIIVFCDGYMITENLPLHLGRYDM